VPDHVGAEHAHLSAGWLQQAQDHRNGRGLAGAVAAQKPHRLAGRHHEADMVDRRQGIEPLGEVIYFDGWLKHDKCLTDRRWTGDTGTGENFFPVTQEPLCRWVFKSASGMSEEPHSRLLVTVPRRGRVRLRTLVAIRWVAIAGQAAALLVVHYGLLF